MRNILFLIPVLLVSISLKAQVYSGQKADEIFHGSEMVRVKDFTEIPNYIRFRQEEQMSTEKALILVLSKIDLPEASFEQKNVLSDELGFVHTRLYQTVQGIPVEYAAWVVHEKGGAVHSMNGNILSKAQIHGSFSISQSQALQSALDYVDAEQYIFEEGGKDNPYKETYNKPVPQKIYFPKNSSLNSGVLIPAYKIDVFALMPYSRQYVYVSAVDGSVLNVETRIYTADIEATAETVYSGTQTITVDSYNGSYRLRDNSRGNGLATFDCNMTDSYDSAVDFVDSDNYWNNINAELDQYATDAQFATQATYDYYLNVHNRNSIDNNGHELNSYVHFNLIEYGYSSNVNAFWNGSVLTYGDGSETYTPLTTVDICAHEITHGLTAHTCSLIYQDESGALNEAFSDIFAVCVEKYIVPSLSDWTIGEDIGSPFRSLSNPNLYNLPDTYHGNYWHYDDSDNGGVHTNMGVLSYWFYLISEGGSGTNDNGDSYNITAVGIDAAAEITHRLQTIYLTNSSNYNDARFYAIQATIDFYGDCSDEVAIITDAFHAIGVGVAYVPEVVADFDANYTENCLPPFTVKFTNHSINGSSFIWDFGDETTSTEVNPEHTYATMGEFDVQLYTNGGTCGEDTELKTGFVSVNINNPCMTFMPEIGNINTSECFGTLFDIGGPEDPYYNNTDATYTIEPDNANQIILHINIFDIEPGSGSTCNYDFIAFYDGPDTSYPLINDTYYCNTNGNPETIISSTGAITIRFHSDPGLTLDGFEIAWECLLNTNPPIANFVTNVNVTCTGLVEFNNLSMNNPEEYLWDFGDGNTSDEVNPMHLYTQSGTYSISLTVSNINGSDTYLIEDAIVVTVEDAISTEDATVCIDSTFTLNVDGEGNNLNWYSDSIATTLVHTGSLWEHNPLQSDTLYYIRKFTQGTIDNVGSINNTSGGGYFGNASYIHYLIFDAYQPFTLLSVLVNAQTSGTRYISLRDADFNGIETIEVYCPQGVSRVDLNLEIPVGTDLQLVGLSSPDLFRTNQEAYVNYPYTIPDVLSINRSSAGDNPTGYYYYFYDWEIELPTCESAPAAMNIFAQDCSTSILDQFMKDISLFPNPVSDILYINGIDNVNSPFTLDFLDLSGRTVYTSVLNVDKHTVSVENLPSGVYFVRIYNENRSFTGKIIKL